MIDSSLQSDPNTNVFDPEEINLEEFDSDQIDEQDEYILSKQKTDIVDVWENNFEEELEKISNLVKKYNIIATDTEFPGINKKLYGKISEKELEYQLIKENVRAQKVIQIGISICDEQGRAPTEISTWQFNFKFDENKDTISEESKALLKSAGIDFQKFNREGLDGDRFAELFIGSNIVCNDEVSWIAFHGGFDFGYFLQLLYGSHIPETSEDFYSLLKTFFPKIYDIKYLIKDSQTMKDYGLQKLASELQVDRIGPQHQAGSDSLLTLATFFQLKDSYYKKQPQVFENGENVIYGIGKGFLGVRDYLQLYKSNDPFGEQQMPLQYIQPNYIYYDHHVFQNLNPQMPEFAQNTLHHQSQQFLHQHHHHYQQQQQWMQMNYNMMAEDMQQQQQQLQQNKNSKDQYGRKKNNLQF